MNKVEIVNAIVEILADKSLSSRGVILLTGPWGSGKTYLYKNEIEKKLKAKLETQKIPLIDVSVFGAESISSVKYSILTEMFSKKITWNKDINKKDLGNFFKVAAQGGFQVFQKYLGTSFLDFKLDPMDLWDNEFVICIDDIERKSEGVKIKDLLGLISNLKDKKGCRILLISNENELSAGSTLSSEEKDSYRKYIEKIVTYRFRVSPDLSEMYDLITSKIDKHEDYFTQNKDLILGLFSRSNVSNLRTLDKVIANIHLLLIQKIFLTEIYLKILIFYTICGADGILSKGSDYFDFNGWALSSPTGSTQSPEDLEKIELIKEFFDSPIEYNLEIELFEYVLTGMLDAKALKLKIHPNEKELNSIQLYLSKIQNREHIFFENDKNIETLYQEATHIIEKFPDDGTASQLSALIYWMEGLKNLLGENMDDLLINRNLELFKCLAKKGDTTFESINRSRYDTYKNLDRYIEAYESNLPEGKAVKVSKKIEELFEANNYYEALEFLKNNSDNLKYVCETILPTKLIIDLYFKDTKFGFNFIKEVISNLGVLHRDPNYSEYKKSIYACLDVLLSDARLEKSDINRLRTLYSSAKGRLGVESDSYLEEFKHLVMFQK